MAIPRGPNSEPTASPALRPIAVPATAEVAAAKVRPKVRSFRLLMSLQHRLLSCKYSCDRMANFVAMKRVFALV